MNESVHVRIKQLERQAHKRTMSPGSLVHIGERKLDAPRITLIEFDDGVFSERQLTDFSSCTNWPERSTVRWINIDGIHEPSTIAALGEAFKLHPLLLEDVMNAGQRPKLEEYDDCLFVVLKMLDVDATTGAIMVEHLSLVLGDKFVITFQEREGDVFGHVRDRLRNSLGRIRKSQADYLLYRLLDAVVDHYFVALEAMADWMEEVEEMITEDATSVDSRTLHTLKRETLFLRKAIWPAREVLGSLSRIEDESLVKPTTQVYFRDVHDHILQVTETNEVQRDILASMLDTYHSALSNRLNEVLKVLAVISTIFIPLTFIAGVYGMNFVHMPELKWWFGYPMVLLLMAGVFSAQMFYFRRKGWF